MPSCAVKVLVLPGLSAHVCSEGHLKGTDYCLGLSASFTCWVPDASISCFPNTSINRYKLFFVPSAIFKKNIISDVIASLSFSHDSW